MEITRQTDAEARVDTMAELLDPETLQMYQIFFENGDFPDVIDRSDEVEEGI